MEFKNMKSFKNLNQDAEEEIMNRTDKIDDEESPAEKILNSILEKLLSIMDKVLTKVDEKLDDPKFMEKVMDVQKHEESKFED